MIDPAIVPMIPTKRPSNLKILRIDLSVAPMDLRIPISLCFSITDIEREPKILKVATAIIKDKIM